MTTNEHGRQSEYAAFLARKSIKAKDRGLTNIPELSHHLFPFQHYCVDFALRLGSSGCFLSTGLGKTEIQLEFCQKAAEASNGRALILTPLAVAGQTKRRADRWGYEATVIREQRSAIKGINICNYDRLDKLDPSKFSVISMDESSIIKNFSGKTTRALTDAFNGYRFKLCATATPAPNDHMELGTHAEFLEIMKSNEMLSRFFINDTSQASQQWRLKGHAVSAFYDWLASWSCMAELPSDITGSNTDDISFTLPPFEIIQHRAKDSRIDHDLADMFGAPILSATTLHDIKRQTIEARAECTSKVVGKSNDPWLIWCQTDYEADAIKRVISDVIEVRGSQSADEKEQKLEAFSTNKAKRLLSKPSLAGFGMDWSHCSNMIFVGQSYSYEQWFQAVRRCWRFGQTKPVKVHLIVAEGEAEIGRVIDRKADAHDRMRKAMRESMRRATGRSSAVKSPYFPTHTARIEPWITKFSA